jgi:predicted kinase
MPKCIMLIGVPASGKSTHVSKYLSNSDVHSTDNIIEQIARGWGYSYDEVFGDLIKFADRAFWDGIAASAENGHDIIIDRTNLTVKGRKRFFQFLREHDYEFEAVVFPTPDEAEWKRRLASRPGKTIPANVLKSMQGSYEAPSMNEGFTDITYTNA